MSTKPTHTVPHMQCCLKLSMNHEVCIIFDCACKYPMNLAILTLSVCTSMEFEFKVWYNFIIDPDPDYSRVINERSQNLNIFICIYIIYTQPHLLL